MKERRADKVDHVRKDVHHREEDDAPCDGFVCRPCQPPSTVERDARKVMFF